MTARRLVPALLATVLTCGCLGGKVIVTPPPTAEQVQAVRRKAVQAIDLMTSIAVDVDRARSAAEAAERAGLIPAAVMDRIDQAVLDLYRPCNAAGGGCGIIRVAVRVLADVTTEPSLKQTIRVALAGLQEFTAALVPTGTASAAVNLVIAALRALIGGGA